MSGRSWFEHGWSFLRIWSVAVQSEKAVCRDGRMCNLNARMLGVLMYVSVLDQFKSLWPLLGWFLDKRSVLNAIVSYSGRVEVWDTQWVQRMLRGGSWLRKRSVRGWASWLKWIRWFDDEHSWLRDFDSNLKASVYFMTLYKSKREMHPCRWSMLFIEGTVQFTCPTLPISSSGHTSKYDRGFQRVTLEKENCSLDYAQRCSGLQSRFLAASHPPPR